MRVLLIHTYYQNKGGEDSVFEQELDLLSDKVNETRFLTYRNENGVKGFSQFLFSIWNIKEAWQIKKQIKRFKPDVVHIHNWHFASGPIIIRTIAKLNIPLVVTLHNYRILCPSGILLYKGKIFLENISTGFSWRTICKKVYRDSILQTFWLSLSIWVHNCLKTWDKVDTYVILSEFPIEIFEKSFLKRLVNTMVVKPNYVMPFQLNANKKYSSKETTVMYVGRLSEEKGIGFLLETFRTLDIVLDIYGDGPLKRLVLDYCFKYDNIRYQGTKSQTELANEYYSHDLLIMPSICYEGMPMTVIEAFSNKTPVIASDIGVLSKMIKDGYNGFLFKPENSKDLKLKLHYWNNLSAVEMHEISQNAYDTYLEKYTPEKNKEMLIDIYKKVINKKIREK